VEENVAAARGRAASLFRPGSAKFAVILQALDAVASNGGWAWLSNLEGVATTHGVTVRAVQRALAEAEGLGVLVRTRGNEGGKRILLTVPVLVERDESAYNESEKSSPTLHRNQTAVVGDISAGKSADATFESWMIQHAEDVEPPPFGVVRRSVDDHEQAAFDEFVREARKGRCIEETLLLTGILPPEASKVLLHVVEHNRAGKRAGAKWLRHIAGEIGELVLSEPDRWPGQLQGALNYVADRMKRTSGRPTACKWVRTLAENVGFIHQRAGRLTPMARAAQAAQLRWGKSERSAV
jgi:hypothetical protein